MTVSATLTPSRTLSFAFVLVTSLFFMWGFSYGLLDVLNKHFQDTLGVTKARSALLQTAYFGAYFVMALPAAELAARRGYKATILLGLALFAGGALLIIPATLAHNFMLFLVPFFIIASGLGCLETAANPYATQLGDPARGAQRLNLSQIFNGLGQAAGPWIGGMVVFAATVSNGAGAPVRYLYVALAVVVLALAVVFFFTPMPEPKVERMPDAGHGLLAERHFVWGVVAQFFYVAAQVGVGAFFINYATLTTARASAIFSYGFMLFMAGRFVGTLLMTWIAPRKLLTLYAAINVALCLVVVAAIPGVSLHALLALFFFMSIMFPTIFALAVQGLGPRTKRASSFLIMSIVGGALIPVVMGWIGDHAGMAAGYWVPTACFAVVLLYAWKFAAPVSSRSP